MNVRDIIKAKKAEHKAKQEYMHSPEYRSYLQAKEVEENEVYQKKKQQALREAQAEGTATPSSSPKVSEYLQTTMQRIGRGVTNNNKKKRRRK